MNKHTCAMNRTTLGTLLLLVSLVAPGCGDMESTETNENPETAVPTVVSQMPLADADAVPLNPVISATFSGAMAEASVTTSFTLSAGDTAVPGAVVYANSKALFLPAALLASDTEFTATITTGATSASGVALESDHQWSFTTGSDFATDLPVDLGRAGDYAILAKSGISTVPSSDITGNMGVSPAAASYITGFSLTADATNEFATSTQVSGEIYAATYAEPTPAKLTRAIADMELAFTAAAGRAPGVTELGAGSIGTQTLEAGVYGWGTGLLIPTTITLDGSADDVWIFQIAQNLTLSSATRVELSGGALAKNVFWQVAGSVELGTTAHLEGNVMSQTAITLGTGATVNGRLLAQTAVELDANTVVEPAE